MGNDQPVVSIVRAWSGALMDNQASGRVYGGAGAGGSLIIGQLGV